jgi:2-oxoglutarate ferredoxin oxidoreductase subunit alpha
MRVSIKSAGAQGQGVNSVGEMCARGLKRAGHHVYGYREYMSLIKGGLSSYQLDVSETHIESTQRQLDILVCFNNYSISEHLKELREGGILLHMTPQWKFTEEEQKFVEGNNINVLYLPSETILGKLKARPILGNILVTAVVWELLGRDTENLKDLVREQFGHKGEKILELNFTCIDEGVAFRKEHAAELSVELPKPDPARKNDLLVTGSEAMGMGMVHAGCRMFAGYPMTPASPLLSYLAAKQNETGMVIKQAEDEITAAQIVSGAMYMGTRAATGTSGGGFDLMTETMSLNGIMENPSVFVLAQRQGPSTGLPTWTGQGDLHLAVGSAHGEFPRLVVGVSDSQDCFDLMPEVFNLAEEYQLPAVVVTDKHAAEGLFMQEPYDQTTAEIRRGNLVTDAKELAKLTGMDRYDPKAKDGVSPRWLPGAEADTYCSQGDEHNGDGTVDETGQNAIEQMEKRMKKMEAMKKVLPEPVLYGNQNPETLIVSWGSNKGAIMDCLPALGGKVGYLHFTYLWPLRTEKFEALAAKAKKLVLVESNYQGQLGKLLRQECGVECTERILKYDGRPFFYDELMNLLTPHM